MFHLIIVDDKKSIRKGLMEFIDWNELGFSVIGDFSSAAEAIRFVESECVDVIMTDIVMPDVNGLELIREVKLINPEIKVIILSAYEKFEYAQEAVRLGAVHYLTKPVNLDKLKEEFLRLRQVLSEEEILRCQKKEYGLFATERFFNNLVSNMYPDTAAIWEKADELNIPLWEGPFCALRIIPEQVPYAEKGWDNSNFQLLKSRIADQLSDSLNEIGKVSLFHFGLTELCALFFPNPDGKVKDSLECLQKDIKNRLSSNVLIGIGRTYDHIGYAPDSFAEAGKALEYRVIKRSVNVLFYEELSDFFRGRSLVTSRMEETILHYLSMQEEEPLRTYILDIMTSVLHVGYNNISTLYNVCIELLLITNKFLTVGVDKKMSMENNDYFSIKSLLQKQNYEEIRDFMLEYLEDSFAMIRSNDEKSACLIIESAKKYINEHYNEEITLSKLSKVVYVNPIYLSRLFKEKEGENFIDYLTGIRIEHAKSLLEDLSLRVYDITEMVGYESRKHFGKIFKEMTGMSPREYRNHISPQT